MPLSCSSVTEETPRCPVAQAEHTAWSLFRHADVSRALLDPATYSSAVSAHLAVPSGIDTPEHTDYRLIIDRYFVPDRMAAVEPKLRAIAVELLSGLPADGDPEHGPLSALGPDRARRAPQVWLR